MGISAVDPILAMSVFVKLAQQRFVVGALLWRDVLAGFVVLA